VPIPEGDVKDSELKLAKQLIDQGTSETFEPAKYKDTVRERVREAIQGKVEGHEITTEPAQDGGGKIIDLMEALKASLASGGDGEDEEEEEAAPKKKAKKKAS
jgi:DNA end-binding protein Ku